LTPTAGGYDVKTAKVPMMFCLVVALLAAHACAFYPDTVIVYDLPAPPTTGPTVRADGEFLVLVSVTGGGSRAALWHAAVMKELYRQVKLPDGRSITDEIDYISSVSGGSLSSAYWCLNKPEADTTQTDPYDAFFDEYLADMRVNIEAKMAGSPLTWYRYLLSSEDRAIVLRETFDALYFGHKTFAELADRQRRAVAPVLIANGTDMETGAKFLFTTLPRTDFEVRPERIAGRSMESLAESDISFGADVFNIVTPDDIGVSVMDMEVSLAVAASSAVPLVLGPVVMRDNRKSAPGKDIYVHVSDGGVNDNQGLLTLIELLYGRAEREGRKFTGAVVIIVDANPRIDPRYCQESVRAFSTIEMIERSYYTCFHQGRAFTFLTIMHVLKDDPRFRDVTFVYLSPYLADDPAISDIFTRTPTRFKITPSQADTVERAAGIVVERARGKILDQLQGSNREH
jgi:predicted acylesterase/phospholipase RssA